MFKKVLATCLAGAMAVSLAACGSSSPETQEPATEAAPEAEQPAAEPVQAEAAPEPEKKDEA